VANDNRPVGDVLTALAALRRLEAPVEKIKFEVARQRWNWAAPLISEVYENATTRCQVIAAGQVAAGWQRYWCICRGRRAVERIGWICGCGPMNGSSG
jgi:hypothetical protein